MAALPVSGEDEVVSNGGGELMEQSMLLEQQEQLVKDRKELKEEVTVLGKKLEDLKLKNNVSY